MRVVARDMEPELFTEYETLSAQRDDLTARMAKRDFRLYANEEPIEESAGIFIGTFTVQDGKFVFHLFEIPTPGGIALP